MCPYMRQYGNKIPVCKPVDSWCSLCIKGNSKLFNQLETLRKKGNKEVEDMYYGKDE